MHKKFMEMQKWRCIKFVQDADLGMLIGLSLKTGHNAFCRDCDYTGPIIEGNDELAEEIHEAYVESLKDDE